MGTRHDCLALLSAALALCPWGVANAREPTPTEIVEKTPCLYELRVWLADWKLSQQPFKVPRDFTKEQCDHAASVNDDLQKRIDAESDRNQAQAAASAAAAARRAAAEAARRQSLPGVRVGMTGEQVINGSHWGAPLRRSRATTAAGTHEIWTYPAGRSLELKNGRVTAIYETD